jgi:hypothetical protein
MANTTIKGVEPRERFEAPERYAGYAVRDPQGRKIGNLEALLVDEHQEPEYIWIRIGFLEFRTILIPVHTVAVDEECHTLVLQ